MMTLAIPAYSAGPNIERTIESCRDVCDDVVIICTAPYAEDAESLNNLGTVVNLPWNYVFLNGFGELHNAGTDAAKNDWIMLLGVGSTFAESYGDTSSIIASAEANTVFRCNHQNESQTWKRIWNRTGNVKLSGIIHEELFGERMIDGGLLFRMHDTEKTPNADPVKAEVFRWIKALSYNHCYWRLLNNPALLGASNHGWLKWIKDREEEINDFCEDNHMMLEACFSGNVRHFTELVKESMRRGRMAYGVGFAPQGISKIK